MKCIKTGTMKTSTLLLSVYLITFNDLKNIDRNINCDRIRCTANIKSKYIQAVCIEKGVSVVLVCVPFWKAQFGLWKKLNLESFPLGWIVYISVFVPIRSSEWLNWSGIFLQKTIWHWCYFACHRRESKIALNSLKCLSVHKFSEYSFISCIWL